MKRFFAALALIGAAPCIAQTISGSAGITSLTGGVTATGPGAAAATVVTNANLTGFATSVGNATSFGSASTFGLSGNISAPAWTTSGIRYKNVAATLTDTSSSGTVAAAYTDLFGGNTIAASSATTFTNYYGAYFKDPIAGTNVTLTSIWSIGADSASIGGATITSAGRIDNTVAGQDIRAGANLQADSGSSVNFLNRSRIKSSADGILTLFNNATSDFTRLTFGGTSSSFPAIKRSSTTLAVRLADDSGDAPITVSNITASGAGVIFSGLGTDSGTTDSNLCLRSDTKAVVTGSGTLGVCLGTSSIRYKERVTTMTDGLPQILALQPVNFYYRKGHGDGGERQQFGLIAEDVVRVLPKLTGRDANGQPNTVDLLGMVPVLIKAVQDQQAQILTLRAQLAKLQQ